MKGFSISKRGNVKENINRILLGQIDYSLKHCTGDQKDVHKSIHEIRKSIKRIRAVLRLIREEIGYSSYYRENVFYRNINRSTSDFRTYDVLVLTLEMLRSDLSKTIPGETFEPLIESVREQREKMLSGMLSADGVLHDLSENFLQAKERISDLPIEHDNFEVFAGGLHRMYQQGRDYLSTARKNPEAHHLHDMRKRMKYLWHQIEILRPVYPGPLKAYADSLENITGNLGVYHDLDVLSEFLQKDDTGLKERIQETLLDACEHKKAALLLKIWSRAGAAFSEKPRALVYRMGEYWKIYYRITS